MEPERSDQFEREALPYIDDVYRFALALTGRPVDAEDAVQETFMRAFRSWHTYTPGSECRRWLFTICRNIVRSRAGAPQVIELDAFEAEAESLASVMQHHGLVKQGIEIVLDGALVADVIGQAIDSLPEPFRSAVVLVDIEDESYQGAAEALGVPIGTVRSRLFRGRRMLQQQLIQHARDAGLRAELPVQ